MHIPEKEMKELENYFAAAQLPETIKLFDAVTYTNLPKFIRDNLEKLKDDSISHAVIMPRYHDLLDIKKYLEGHSA